VERVVAPVHVLALAVRLSAAHVAAESGCPLVDLRLERVQGKTAVELGIAASEHVEVDLVEDGDLHGEPSLVRDQSIERTANLRVRELHVPPRAVVLEEDQSSLLVTPERFPCTLAIDA